MTIDTMLGTLSSLKDIILGMAGGTVAYLFDYSRAQRANDTEFVFSISSMAVNIGMGAFVAYSVGTLIPLDTFGRDAIIGFSGVTAYNILLLAESKFAIWLFDKLIKSNSSKKEV